MKYTNEQLAQWKRDINAGPIIAQRISIRREGAEWKACCPFHKNGQERTPSFTVYKLPDGTWAYKCFGCGENGNVFQFIERFDKVFFTRAVEIVLEIAGETDPAELESKANTPKKITTFSITEYEPAERALEDSGDGQKWITDRGISMETARRFHLGFVQDATAVCGTDHPWRKGGWVTFPYMSANQMRVLGAKYRSVVGKNEIVDGEPVCGIRRAPNTGTMLFNLREVNDVEDVIICEGEPDTLVLSQTGVPAVGLPMSGYRVRADEITVLKRAKRRFLAGDNTVDGIEATDRLGKELGPNTFIIRWPNGRKDANDVLLIECGGDEEKFAELLDELKTKAQPFVATEPAPPAEVQSPMEPTSSLIVRPTLNEAAYYGLVGAMTKKLEPHTESHPAGVLIELLVAFGNVIGRSAYIQIEDTKHFTNEFMVKVGETARARKGTGRNRVKHFMELVDSTWTKRRNISGIGSGEVIIHQIRDPRIAWVVDKKSGEGKNVVVDNGVEDKRLLINIGEFQGILAVCHRPDNLLSVVMRDGWDGVALDNLVKTDPANCQEPHLSLDADTTASDLSVSMSQAEKNNGFANRILWVYVYRNKLLALGGDDMDWTAEAVQFREAVESARNRRRVFLDEPARHLWKRTMYPKLERDIPGLIGAITSRASAHTLRLALIFALLDQAEHIRVEHLEAAHAVWQYCEDSAKAVFGDLVSPDQQQIMEFLASVPSATKTQIIRDCFRGNRKAAAIGYDLDVLKSLNRVADKTVDRMTYWSKADRTKSVNL